MMILCILMRPIFWEPRTFWSASGKVNLCVQLLSLQPIKFTGTTEDESHIEKRISWPALIRIAQARQRRILWRNPTFIRFLIPMIMVDIIDLSWALRELAR